MVALLKNPTLASYLSNVKHSQARMGEKCMLLDYRFTHSCKNTYISLRATE